MDPNQPGKYPRDHVTVRYHSNIRIASPAAPSDTGVHYNFHHVLSC